MTKAQALDLIDEQINHAQHLHDMELIDDLILRLHVCTLRLVKEYVKQITEI